MYGTRYTYVKKSDAKRVPHLLFKTAYLRCLMGHPTEAALPVVVAKIRLPQQPITGISLAACPRPMTNRRPTKQPTHRPTTDRRVSVAEAAVLLDLSEAAVRSRLKRGTLRKEKAKDGTVLVVLGTGASPDRPTN